MTIFAKIWSKLKIEILFVVPYLSSKENGSRPPNFLFYALKNTSYFYFRFQFSFYPCHTFHFRIMFCSWRPSSLKYRLKEVRESCFIYQVTTGGCSKDDRGKCRVFTSIRSSLFTTSNRRSDWEVRSCWWFVDQRQARSNKDEFTTIEKKNAESP